MAARSRPEHVSIEKKRALITNVWQRCVNMAANPSMVAKPQAERRRNVWQRCVNMASLSGKNLIGKGLVKAW